MDTQWRYSHSMDRRLLGLASCLICSAGCPGTVIASARIASNTTTVVEESAAVTAAVQGGAAEAGLECKAPGESERELVSCNNWRQRTLRNVEFYLRRDDGGFALSAVADDRRQACAVLHTVLARLRDTLDPSRVKIDPGRCPQ